MEIFNDIFKKLSAYNEIIININKILNDSLNFGKFKFCNI